MYTPIRILLMAVIVYCASLTAGCQYHQKVDGDLPAQSSWGQSFRQQLALQRVNPDPAPATPVTGLDGTRAAEVMETYRTPDAHEDGVARALESLMRIEK